MNDSIEIFAIFFVCLLLSFVILFFVHFFLRSLACLLCLRFHFVYFVYCVYLIRCLLKTRNCLLERKSVDVLAARSMIFYQFNVKHVDDETK